MSTAFPAATMTKRTTRLALAVSLLLLIPSCVELVGQRISWFHDQAKDTLTVLLHYDGIHEGTGSSEKGVDQLPEFIRDGDVMILDWWAHLNMGPIRAKLETGNLLEKLVARTLTSFQVRAVGHYRDPEGRIGALQVMTIPRLSRLLKSLNEMISLAIKADKLTVASMPKSTNLQKDAAGDRHEWLSFDGHALRIRIPVHPDEVAQLKWRYLRRGVSRAFARTTEAHQDLVSRVVQQIAAAPFSVIQEEEMLTLVLGYESRPTTIRITARDDYNTDLDEAVRKNVPTDLDRGFAEALIARTEAPEGKAPEIPGLFGDLLEWGPPEDQVGALLATIAGSRKGEALPQLTPGATRLKATRALQRFGAAWNVSGRMPAAPKTGDDELTYVEGWEDWYLAMTGRPRKQRR